MRGLSIACLVVGVILLVFGFQASESLASEVKETFTGNPTKETIWYIIGGAALCVIGGSSLFLGGRKSR